MILVGIIGVPHGIRGAVKIRVFTQAPGNILAYGIIQDEKGREYSLQSARVVGQNNLIAFIEGVNDRTGAELLRGIKLYIKREQLPEPDEQEYYYADLIGLRVQNLEGQEIGHVHTVNNFGAGDFLEIITQQNQVFTISFTNEAVPNVVTGKGSKDGYIEINPLHLLDSTLSAPEKNERQMEKFAMQSSDSQKEGE